MIAAPSLNEIAHMLNEERPLGRDGYLTPIADQIGVLGIIFIPPDTAEKNTSNLLYNIGLLDKTSGKHFHFLLVGISQYGGERKVGTLNGADLYFNTSEFIEFEFALMERLPGWMYDHGIELLLIDIKGDKPNRYLSFDNYISFKLDELVKAEICENPAQFLGKIIRLARESKLRTVVDIKSFFESQFGVNWVKALILSMFPKSIQKLARVTAVLGGGRAQITLG